MRMCVKRQKVVRGEEATTTALIPGVTGSPGSRDAGTPA